MKIFRVYPPSSPIGDPVDAGESALEALLSPLYEPLGGTAVRINLIASVDGSGVGSDGTSDSLSSQTDRTLLRVIRSFADVVVVGAATVRREGYRMPRSARLAVVTASGSLEGHRVEPRDGMPPLLVICPRSAVPVVQRSVGGGTAAEIIVLADERGRVSMTDVIAALAERSLHRVVCEGGPALAAQFLEADLVDEICLTTAPVVGGANRIFGDVTGPHRVSLTQLLVDDSGYQFARWSLRSPGAAGLVPTR